VPAPVTLGSASFHASLAPATNPPEVLPPPITSGSASFSASLGGEANLPDPASPAALVAAAAAECNLQVDCPGPPPALGDKIADKIRERREQLWRDYKACYPGNTLEAVAAELQIVVRTLRAWIHNEHRKNGNPKVARKTGRRIEEFIQKAILRASASGPLAEPR
jgi:hypothetical protein